MNLVRYTLKAPGDGALRRRIENARIGFSELVREARARKLDPGDAEYAAESLRLAQNAHPGTWGISDRADRMLKAAMTNHRAHMLALLDEMDAWDFQHKGPLP
ncbi:hypothetical protein BAJUN_03210 [Bajunvirus bajun]|uniref:Uncharacterized protein n=1 Tax=Brevundimonas phage vB_BgoS-Bajun TaxID=2948594 RepID=A0A9E7N724_9CAUD|nr:hypothetical protein BAJUN_03210 [Brevundimonas phage vB_BgoS-Bajun]